jgi:GT2 family glycosyltransferase
MPSAEISVVIVNWNTRQHLQGCLESLQNAKASRLREIIVVDNASTDGSPEMVAQVFPNVRLLRNPSNAGFAAANNLGIRAGAGSYVCLVNSDVRVLPGSLDALAGFLDAHPDVGMTGPRLLWGDLTLQSSCRRFPSLWNNLCDAFALPRIFPRSPLVAGEHMAFFKHDREIFPDVLVGCFWMVRRQAIERFGYLDEGFFMYGEDIDWCLRCWKSGWKIAFFPGASAVHYGGGSSRRERIRFAVLQQQARQRLWKKHYGRAERFGLVCLLACGSASHWLANAMRAVLNRNRGDECFSRMRENAACLRALVARR